MKLKVNEIFKSLQGEGRHQGAPVTFIRLSGCTRECPMCDSKYHTEGREYTTNKVVNSIRKLPANSTIVWTGGEPLLQLEAVKEVISKTEGFPTFTQHHLESNGDTIMNIGDMFDLSEFRYVCISPKDLKTTKRIFELREQDMGEKTLSDIKVVTDMDKMGKSMLRYATMLMPLTVYDEKRDQSIRQRVWQYCSDHNLMYSGRLHISVWGKKMKV